MEGLPLLWGGISGCDNPIAEANQSCALRNDVVIQCEELPPKIKFTSAGSVNFLGCLAKKRKSPLGAGMTSVGLHHGSFDGVYPDLVEELRMTLLSSLVVIPNH